MRKHAVSDSRKVVRKLGDPESEKIGSRALPLRGQAAPMPSVGTRRSTRVFVRKNVSNAAPDGDPAARVLRSGKRLTLSKPVGSKPDGDGAAYGWMGLFGSSGDMEDADWWKGRIEGFRSRKGDKRGQMVKRRGPATERFKLGGGSVEDELPKHVLDVDSAAASLRGRAFGIVYSRKRRRSPSNVSDSLRSPSSTKETEVGSNVPSDELCFLSSMLGDKCTEDRRFGIAFVRKPRSKKRKLLSAVEGKPRWIEFSDIGREITETARYLAEKVGISERYLRFGPTSHIALVVLIIHSTGSANLRGFTCFLVSVLTGMMKEDSLFDCAARAAASLSPLHGVHLVPVRRWKSDFSRRVAMSDVGFCIIYCSRLLVPLVSVNFSAIPFLFKSWHLSLSLGSLYLPSTFARYKKQWYMSADTEVSVEERRLCDLHVSEETGTYKVEIISLQIPLPKETEGVCRTQISPAKELSGVTGAPESSVRSKTIINGINLQKRRRKRTFLRSVRVSSRSLLKSRRNILRDTQSSVLKVDTRAKVHPVREGCEIEPFHLKPPGSFLGEVGTDEHVALSPTSPIQKRRRCASKNSVQRMNESAFAKVVQNVDMFTCTANILVIESDRCWREEGARVMLELSGSNEWCLAVKFEDTTRFLHKAQEMKPSSSNRYTHAIMWNGESGWKLEFCDKNDWSVFKELHKECCERNMQEIPVRIIPVPGVREISGYEENLSSFMRPDFYIHMVNDEVDRVLMSENACYDMDSGDEEWIEHMNSRLSSADSDSSTVILKDNFEKIISAFEKAAYNHPEDVYDKEKAASLCSHFGESEMVAAIFNYWMKKRKQKHSSLIRAFQGQPPRKRQLTQKPLLRKKRSFKRQGSHAGRGKPDIFFEAAAKEDALRKLQLAEAAANRATDIAIRRRSRAQVLMTNADLATYKSVMAFKLAEALQESEFPDLSPSVLD